MLKLKKNERVDWFQVIADVQACGIKLTAFAKMTGTPRTTMQCWRMRESRPRLEESIEVLNAWADITGKDLDDVPFYNPYVYDDKQIT